MKLSFPPYDFYFVLIIPEYTSDRNSARSKLFQILYKFKCLSDFDRFKKILNVYRPMRVIFQTTFLFIFLSFN